MVDTESLSDWSERYRPVSEKQLEGNPAARKRISLWLESWSRGVPEQKGLLLSGPPGVGKTSIVTAIANDLGWDVVELNASDARNAAAIRRAGNAGSTSFTFSLDGSFESDGNRRTIILLDEVDHLHGTLTQVSEERISNTISSRRGEDVSGRTLRGDSGGKAELLKLLKNTTQPIIMTCNDPMGLWGRRNKHWKSARDRFLKEAEQIQFRRVTKEAMKKITLRILDAENLTSDPPAIEHLLNANPGDLRALIKDLQMIAESGIHHLSIEHVEDQISRGLRDQQVDLFPGLDKIYRCGDSREASRLIRDLEKTPKELVAWISWNNGSVLRGRDVLHKAANGVANADQALHATYTNNAYRSWYWAGQLSSLSACIHSETLSDGRLYLSFPDFMRRGNEPWRRVGLINKMTEFTGSSKKSAREELWPALMAIHDDGDIIQSDDFSLSLAFGLDADEHLLLHNLPSNRASSKKLAERYITHQDKESIDDLPLDDSDDEAPSESPAGQQRLDLF